MTKRASSIEYRKELKEKILDVSIRMFSAHGVKAVKMDDIAAKLSISKRTLYELYPTKEELIFETFKRNLERDVKNFYESINQKCDTMDILTEFFRLRIRQMRNAHPNFVEEVHSYPRVREFIEQFKQEHKESAAKFYVQGQEEGYIRKDINLDLICEINRILNDSFFSTKRYQLYKQEDILRAMMTIFIRSICTLEGVKRFDEMMAVDANDLTN